MDFALVYTYVIQFCPSLVHDERLNVGLVAVGSESHTLRLQLDPKGGERAAALWSLQYIRALVEGQCGALAARLNDVRELAGHNEQALREGVEQVGRRLANELVLVDPRQRLMPDTDAAFADLYNEVVVPPARPVKQRVPRVNERLRQVIASQGIASMLAPNVELEVELLGQRRVQKFPYG